MKTSSAKAKGRRLQQYVRDSLLALAQWLEPDDIQSRGMGQNGVDLMLSPRARKDFPFSIECKNVESLNVIATFTEHYTKYENDNNLKLLIHSKNRLKEPLVTLRWSDFLAVWSKTLQGARLSSK